MRILITNDDGYFSPGIQILRQGLIAHSSSFSVSMVAPDRDNSACGMSITLRQSLAIRELDEQAYAVSGTPADCVGLALGSDLVGSVDIVISGVNNGTNMGDDVLYSGTVAAAVEARRLSLPNLAVSMTSTQPKHYATAVRVVLDVLERLPLLSCGAELALLNINVPDVAYDQLKGVKVTRLAKRQAPLPPRVEMDAKGVCRAWLGAVGDFVEVDESSDYLYDFQAIAAGYASVTPIQASYIDQPYLDGLQQCLLAEKSS